MHPHLESLESQVCVIFAVPDSRAMLCRCRSWSASSAEVDSVSKRHRSFLFASLLPAFLVVSAFAVLQAQEGKSTAAKPARWSDPATWPDRQVPRAGDKVTIAAGKDVVLDVSPTTERVMVHGELEIGTEARPHTRKATITLTDNVKGEDIGVPAATVASERVDR